MKVGASKEMYKSKEGEGSPMLSLKRRYLPLELRIKLYEEVLKLRGKGLSYSKIAEEIYKKHKIRLYKATISRWINGKIQPSGNVNKFNAESTPELAYIIGTILGDGIKYHYNAKPQYQLGLVVKDKEFAKTFGKNLAKVLSRKEPYKPFYSPSKKYWVVKGYSKLLFNFLNKPLKELMIYIEYNRNCVSTFLKGLFDSEGSIRKGGLIFYNTNKELLNYVDYLLKKYFNINVSLHLIKKAGKIHRFPNGIYKTTKDEYGLYIRAENLMNFYKYIGFTIKRKQQRLIEAIKNQNTPFLFLVLLI